MTTFLAPPLRCADALSVVVKTPVDSTTYSAPQELHEMAEGSRLPQTLCWPPKRALHWHLLAENLDCLTVDHDATVAGLDRARILAVYSVVFEHIAHVVSRDERIVNAHDLYLGVVRGRTHHETTNTAEAVDSNLPA